MDFDVVVANVHRTFLTFIEEIEDELREILEWSEYGSIKKIFPPQEFILNTLCMNLYKIRLVI